MGQWVFASVNYTPTFAVNQDLGCEPFTTSIAILWEEYSVTRFMGGLHSYVHAMGLAVLLILGLFFVIALGLAIIAILIMSRTSRNFFVRSNDIDVNNTLIVLCTDYVLVTIDLIITVHLILVGPVGGVVRTVGQLTTKSFAIHLRPTTRKCRPARVQRFGTTFGGTTRRLSNARLLHGSFIGGFSRRFGAPVIDVDNFTSLLLSRSIAPRRRHRCLRVVHSRDEQLTRLSNDILLLGHVRTRAVLASYASFSLSRRLHRYVLIAQRG